MLDYFSELRSAVFLYPYFLWSTVLCVFLLALTGVRKEFRSFAFLLKILALLALLIAAATPLKTSDKTNSEIVVAVDVSESIPDDAIKSYADILHKLSLEKDQSVSVVSFAKDVEAIGLAQGSSGSYYQALKRQQGRKSSNIAAALAYSAKKTEASAVVLLTDGHQTTGDAIAEAQIIAKQGIKLFPFVPDVSLFLAKDVSISSIQAPLTTYVDEKPILRLSLRNDSDKEQTVLLKALLEGNEFINKEVAIKANSEIVVTQLAPLLKGGLQKFDASISQGNNIVDQKHRWISVKERAKMMMISGSKDDADLLERALHEKGYVIKSIIAGSDSGNSESFKNVSVVIYNNIHKKQIPDSLLANLKQYVADGGGLILVGGEKSFGLGQYKDTVLEEISPVKFVPPQTTKKRLNNAVMLIMDKSRSMNKQGRIDAARKAAISSINSLKDNDYVGVIGFDESPFPIIKMELVSKAKKIAQSRLRNLTAAGGTALRTSLSAARKQLERVDAGRKHIIILSDGEIPDASQLIFQELEKLKAMGVTVSTIALGYEADVPFMTTLAEQGHGSFYQVEDSYRLPEIFLKDIKVSTGEKTLRENQNFPVYLGEDGLHSTSLKYFPDLLGYVQSIKKPESVLELIVKDRDGVFPILANWKFGQGRVTAFASDANGRWSAKWVRWGGFVEFWSDLVEKNKSQSGDKQDVEFDLRYQIEGRRMILDLSVFDLALLSKLAPSISASITSPSGENRQYSFSEIKKGRFQSEIEELEAGDYRIEVSYGQQQFPPLAVTVASDALGERKGEGVNLELLGELARITKGTLNPDLTKIPRSVRTQSEREYLSTPLFVLSFLLFLAATLLREKVGLSKIDSGTSKLRKGIHDSLRK